DGTEIKADVIMMAVGRRPATRDLGCDKADVKLGDKGEVIVNEASQSSVPHIYAVGDVTNRIELTPVAIREGHAFADSEFGEQDWDFDHDNVPSAVFTQPEVGIVGMTEAQARRKYGKIDIYKTRFRPMKNMLHGQPERVMIKLVVKEDDQKVIGVHIVSPDAGEMIQMIGVAVKMGATKADFDRTCAVHPTIAEEIVTLRQKWVPEVEPG
ncbi:MAG: FAD-dependent oxidoreductase, partial [Henriciella sp.]